MKFLKVDSFDDDSQTLVQSYFTLNVMMRTTMLLTSTFYILFIIELVDYQQAAVLISIGFIVQAVIDYPTGVLADLIGHRWVLFAAFIGHAIAFSMLGLITTLNNFDTFSYLVIVYIFESFALAQESGALQSWFDNNYKLSVGGQDSNRETYRIIYGKTLMILRFLGGIGIFVGGAISSIFGNRELVFLIQAIFMVIIAFLFLSLMPDNRGKKKVNISVSTYYGMLRDGIKVILSSRIVFFFFLGFILIVVTGFLWVSLIVFPIYFGYTGSDALASTLRTILFITGAGITGFGTTLSKKMDPKIWLPRIFLLNGIGFYGIYVIILYLFPLNTDQSKADFNLIPLILVFTVAALGSLISTMAMLLFQRVMVDIIPDENRNSFYSLAPTFGLLISALIVPYVGGFINETQNFSLAIFLFLVLPMIVATVFATISMKTYEPGIPTTYPHPHSVFIEDSLFINLRNAFKTALPPELSADQKIEEAWGSFLNEVTSHVNESDDIHAFLDQVINDIYKYNEVFNQVLQKGELSYECHQNLSKLRKELFGDIEKMSDKHQLSEKEKTLLSKLMRVLHLKEHQIGTFETPTSIA